MPSQISPFALGAFALIAASYVAGCAAGSAAKYTTPSTSIPAPLVAALMDGRGTSGTPSLLVGVVPPGYPAGLVPHSPARIVGSMIDGGELLVVFEDTTRRIAADLEDVFVREGYERPVRAPGSGFQTGFAGGGFCGDSGRVSVTPLGGAQRHMARVSFRKGNSRSTCLRPLPEAAFVRLKIPELVAPPGGRMNSAGGGASTRDVNSSGLLSGSALAPVAVAAHYAEQLTANGWTGSSPAVSDQVVAQYFEAKDETGTPWSGTLLVTRNGTNMVVTVTMRLRNSR